MNIFVIIPAYNESRSIYRVVRDLINYAQVNNLELTPVVVDDASADHTYQEAVRAGAVVLRHYINLDQGGALKTGNAYAIAHGADAVIHYDADGQHTVSDITTLLEPLERGECEVVLGSRFLKTYPSTPQGHTSLWSLPVRVLRLLGTESIPFFRRVLLSGSYVLNTLITGMVLTDAHNGLRAMLVPSLERMQLIHNGKAHATEYLQEIKRLHLSFKEVPVVVTYNQEEKRSQNFFDGLKILKDIILGKITR